MLFSYPTFRVPACFRKKAATLFAAGAVGFAWMTATPAIAQFGPSGIAGDTITVPQEFARQRVVEVEVTQMGLVLDLGGPITSVNLSHMSDVVFTGLDGVLCDAKAECSEAQPPTKLLLRRIPAIKFKQQLPSPDGTRLLFVSTASGVYRFGIKPKTTAPDYTLVVIQSGFPSTETPQRIPPGFSPTEVPAPTNP